MYVICLYIFGNIDRILEVGLLDSPGSLSTTAAAAAVVTVRGENMMIGLSRNLLDICVCHW